MQDQHFWAGQADSHGANTGEKIFLNTNNMSKFRAKDQQQNSIPVFFKNLAV
jgi:hypothetical protein